MALEVVAPSRGVCPGMSEGPMVTVSMVVTVLPVREEIGEFSIRWRVSAAPGEGPGDHRHRRDRHPSPWRTRRIVRFAPQVDPQGHPRCLHSAEVNYAGSTISGRRCSASSPPLPRFGQGLPATSRSAPINCATSGTHLTASTSGYFCDDGSVIPPDRKTPSTRAARTPSGMFGSWSWRRPFE